MKTRSSGEIAEAEEGRYLGKNLQSFEANRISSEDKQHYILMKKDGRKGENMLFNTELETDRIEIYEGVRKNENFDRLERDPVKFKDAFIENSGIVSLMSDSAEDSDFDEEFSAVDARRMRENAHQRRAAAEDRNQDAEDRVQLVNVVAEDRSQGEKAKVDSANRIDFSSSSSSDIASNSEMEEESENLNLSKTNRFENVKHGEVPEPNLNVGLNENEEIALDDSMKAKEMKISDNMATEITATDDAELQIRFSEDTEQVSKSSSFAIMSSNEVTVSTNVAEDEPVIEVANSATENSVTASTDKDSVMMLDSSSDVKKLQDQIIPKSMQDNTGKDMNDAISITDEIVIDSTIAGKFGVI